MSSSTFGQMQCATRTVRDIAAVATIGAADSSHQRRFTPATPALDAGVVVSGAMKTALLRSRRTRLQRAPPCRAS